MPCPSGKADQVGEKRWILAPAMVGQRPSARGSEPRVAAKAHTVVRSVPTVLSFTHVTDAVAALGSTSKIRRPAALWRGVTVSAPLGGHLQAVEVGFALWTNLDGAQHHAFGERTTKAPLGMRNFAEGPRSLNRWRWGEGVGAEARETLASHDIAVRVNDNDVEEFIETKARVE